MSCACKKKVEKIKQYDRKLSGKNGETITETVTETMEYETLSFGQSFINVFKFFGLLILGLIMIGIIIPSVIIWLIYHIFKKVVLRKESKINSPFYEYDKIKKKIKAHNEKMRNIMDSKREKEVDTTIKI